MVEISQIEAALSVLSSISQDKREALHFLESFQKTPESWQIIMEILASNDSSIELKMFSAQTLTSKLTYDLNQLPQESLPGLKNSLIQFLIQYSNLNNKPIRTQLCISLAKLSIQYLNWPNTIQEISEKLSSIPNTLLEFLKILPEETYDPKKTPLTDEEFNIRVNQLITSNVENVLILLSNTNNNPNLILSCLNSWITEISLENLLKLDSLINLIFNSLSNEDYFENSIECLISIIGETKDIENLQIIQALYNQIILLKPLLTTYRDDIDNFGNLSRLFVEAGETWHVLIAKYPVGFKELVEILLQCTSYDEDLDIVKYTFYFWYNLKQMILLDRYKQARIEFNPIYTQLIHIMINHLKYPVNGFDNKEEEDKFKDFRYDMGDVLKDCTAVVGSTVALTIPYEKIESSLSNNSNWQDVEAPLFSLRTMAKEVSLKENLILPKIMDLLIQLPENAKIRYAATLVLGRYTEWTSKHPEFLEKQLNYIINGFESYDMDIITAASHALMYFCKDCSKLLTNFIEQLYEFYLKVFQSSIDITSVYEITEGISYIINTQEESKIQQITTTFIKPVIEKLSSYLSLPQTEELNVKIANEIEILRIFFDSIRPRDINNFNKPDPIGNLIIEIYPIVEQLIQKFGFNSTKVSERCTKYLKTILQNYNLYLESILPSIANLLVQGFETTRFGCYLWVSGTLIKEFGDEEYGVSLDLKNSIWEFSKQQIIGFLNLVNLEIEGDISKLISIPDLIEDFFRMMNDVLMFFFKEFLLLNDELLNSVFKFSIFSLNINKFEPLISDLHFLIDLVSWGFESPPISIYYDDGSTKTPEEVKFKISSLINNNGQVLINELVNGLIFKFSEDSHPDAYDLLIKTLKLSNDTDQVLTWLDFSITNLQSVSNQEREKLLTTVKIALSSKDYRRIRTSLKDFVTWYSRKNLNSRIQN